MSSSADGCTYWSASLQYVIGVITTGCLSLQHVQLSLDVTNAIAIATDLIIRADDCLCCLSSLLALYALVAEPRPCGMISRPT